MDFHILDAVVGFLVLFLGLKGLVNGVVKEIFGLLGLIGGVFLSSRFSAEFGHLISPYITFIQDAGILKLISFAVLFILIWLGMIAMGNIVSKLVKMSGLGFFDRIAGAFVGGAKIALVFSIIAYVFGSVGFLDKVAGKHLEGSKLYPFLYDLGSYIVTLDSTPVGKTVIEVRESMGKAVSSVASDAVNDMQNDSLKDLSKNIPSLDGVNPEELRKKLEQIKENKGIK